MAFEGSPNPSSGSITPSCPTPTQWFNELAEMHIVLARTTRAESVTVLNQILADTLTLRDLYKKHHGQSSGVTAYQLHLPFDMHRKEQEDLIDAIAERIQTLGGGCIAMASGVAETTMLVRPPPDCEEPSLQLAQLIDAHERVLYGVRVAAWRVAALGDDGTHDLLISEVIRTNERQAWLVREHLQWGCPPPGSWGA